MRQREVCNEETTTKINMKQNEADEIFKEFVTDLATFSLSYVERIRLALIQNAPRIFKEKIIVGLLHEYTVRVQQEREEYVSDAWNAVKHNLTFRPSNNCLTHSDSYRDVLRDLLRPYWEE